MKVISNPEDWLNKGTKTCLAIGFFDGVHLGHQQVIRQTIEDARRHSGVAIVVTFDRHPNTVVAPKRAPLLIYPLEEKIEAIGSLGVDVLHLIRFDASFSQQSGEAFVRTLANQYAPLRSISVGGNFVFGNKRSGNVELLRRLGDEIDFFVHGLAAVSLDGQSVSSTRIRERIRAGALDAAGQMLGRPYSLSGRVVGGHKRGQEIGFPTANLDVAGLVLPPNGVYAALVTFEGATHQAVANIGQRPTVNDATAQVTAEAHVLDFNGNLYGKMLKLKFVERLRGEQKFGSLNSLRDQISHDIEAARRLF